MNIFDILQLVFSCFFLFLGVMFIGIGAFGMFRFHNIWSRVHASGIIESLGFQAILVGLMIHEGLSRTTIKIFIVSVLIFIVSPAITHAISNAIYHDNPDHSKSIQKEDKK